MKSLIMILVAAFGLQAFAAAPAGKTLLFCDYVGQTQNVFMDLYFDYNTDADVYTNPEVGFLNDAGLEYPDYLWTVGNVDAQDKATTAFTVTKDSDTLTYTLPISTKSVNGADVSGVALAKDADGKIQAFDLPFTGTVMGNAVEGTFNCYVPEAPTQQQR